MGLRKIVILLASMASAVLLAGGVAVAQSTPPEHPYYEFADKWSVDSPESIAVDSENNVYVVNYAGVKKFTSEGTFVNGWSVRCITSGIAVDSHNRIYVASGGGGACTDIARVQKFNSNGTLLTQWGTPGTADDQFRDPTGLAVDSQDNVYVLDVLDRGGARVKKYTSEGTFITKWDSGDGRFFYPEDLAADSQDNVYVMDTHNDRVQKFTSDGTFLKKWGGFVHAEGIATDSHDNVYVSDWFDGSVKRFTSEGEFVTRWGSEGEANGEFQRAADVAVDSQGFAYVADYWNDRIQKFAEVEDTIAPKSTASFSPYPNRFGRVNEDTSVFISAEDQGVGVKELTYEATGAQQIDATTVSGSEVPLLTISEEGKTTITFFATDRADNIEQPPKSTAVWVDKTPPQVDSTLPEPNATGVARDVVVEATFTEAMDPSKINAPNLRLPRLRLYEKGSTTPLAATVDYDAQTRKATLTPEALLKAGVTYRAQVYPAATDLAYNRLDQNPSVEGNQGKKWFFTVRG